MDVPLFKERISRLRERLREKGVDCIWIVQPENRRYLSGFRATDLQLTESSGSLLINEHDSLLLTDSRYTEEASREAVGFAVKTIQNGIVKGLAGLLPDLGTRRLGFEKDYVTWGIHQELEKTLGELSPPVELVPLDGIVEEMREVKDADEIAALQASADLLSAVMGEIIDFLEPGLTERAVAWKVEELAREGGAEDLAFPSIVASGPNSALPHAVPTDRRLEQGDAVVLDLGVKLNGYCSDMTRTVFLGTPSPVLKKIYRTVREAQAAAIREIRPGLETTFVDGIARNFIKKAGFGDHFGHGLGHGVGLATHEGPRLGPRKPAVLKEGMVVTVEPGIYLPGEGGVRLEEMVLLTAGGARILTRDSHFYDW
ncbi:MAG: aminopeptidase P family protein [Deltaproteobacteria bacterium]|nr:aminopeptidase P family protein [Deltaproteobacteria bacterium]